MNRREFLSGILAAGVVAKIPASQLTQPLMPDFSAAISKVLLEHMENYIIYGMSGIESIAEFPYIRAVHPSEFLLEDGVFKQTKGGII